MPEPDSVMAIPAWVPAVIAVAGMKENVAVVAVALIEEESVTASPLMAAACAVPTWCMKSRQAKAHSLYFMIHCET